VGQDNTRTKLLAAAEHIVVQEGLRALTVRRVGQVASLNPTLITYHFGTVTHMLEQLYEENLAPLLDGWAMIDQTESGDEDSLARLLDAWLRPMFAPAAFNPDGRALIVIDEIAAHGEREMSGRLIEEMSKVAHRLDARIAPLLPHLSAGERMARLRFLAGAALGPPPRTRGSGIAPDGSDHALLLRFALAALRDREACPAPA